MEHMDGYTAFTALKYVQTWHLLSKRDCAQPDHNPPPKPMRETKTKTIGLGT